jgi:hypothetical protein
MTRSRTRRGPGSIDADDSASEEERAAGGQSPKAVDPGERGVLADCMQRTAVEWDRTSHVFAGKGLWKGPSRHRAGDQGYGTEDDLGHGGEEQGLHDEVLHQASVLERRDWDSGPVYQTPRMVAGTCSRGIFAPADEEHVRHPSTCAAV